MSALRRLLVHVLPPLVAATSVLVLSASARADDTSDLAGLLNESVVSTASKSAEVEVTAPATTTTITAEDLRHYGIHTLAEAIDFLSLGAVTSDAQKLIDVGARGVMIPNDNEDHFLLLLDGHSMNEPLIGSSRIGRSAGIPLEMVDHIEVILGPGSVLYGSHAMLGVINVITKRAKDWKGAHAGVEVEPGKSWRVVGGAATPFTWPLLKMPGEIALGAEYYKQDGPPLRYELEYGGLDRISFQPYRFHRDGPANGYWGGVARNGYYSRVPSGYARVAIGNLELRVQAKMAKLATPYRGRYLNDFLDFDDPDSYDLERALRFDLSHTATISSVVRLVSRAYLDGWDWQNYINSSEASACLSAGDSTVATCTLRARALARWAGAEMRLELDWLENNHFVTTLGADGRLRQGKFALDFLEFPSRRALQSSTAIIDHQDHVIGPYIQQTWVPTRALSFNGGARLDSEKGLDPVLSPRLAAALKTWQGGTFKGIYAEAFRSPSFIERDLEESIQLRSQSLAPERVRSIEGSFEQRFGAQRVLFGVFRSWWMNMVENHVLTGAETEEAFRTGAVPLYNIGIAQFRNVSTIENYGFNGAYEGSLGSERQFRYGVNATGAIARRSEPGARSQPLVVAPSVFGNARVAYDLPDDWPVLALAAHWMGPRPVDRAYDGGWTTGTIAAPQVELRATVTGPVPKLKGLSYRASVNYAIESHGPYVVGPQQVIDQWNPVPQTLPIDQVRATVGLQYDLAP